jgi:hypothetical protein
MSSPVLLPHDEGSEAAMLWRARGPASEWAAGGARTDPGTSPETLPKIAVLLIGDGRDELRQQTLSSFLSRVFGYRLGYVVQVDDRRHEMGFGGAIRAGWHYLAEALREASLEGVPPPFDYVFHLEEDWVFRESIDLRWLAAMLGGGKMPGRQALPVLAQAALKRGPVNAVERAAGGLIEQWPHEYRDAGIIGPEGAVPYVQHRLFFTTNPSLYRASLMLLGWPEGAASERAFTDRCLEFGYWFGYYGERTHPPTIEHTGTQRTGGGY